MKKTILILTFLLFPFFTYSEVFENIVIKVNNKIVSQYELSRFRTILQATMPGQSFSLEQAKKQLTQILILEYYTEENNIEIGDKDVVREISEISDRMKLSSEKEIRDVLSKQFNVTISADDLKDFIRKQLIFKKSQEHLILHKKRNELKQPTEQEVVDFYNKNKKYFIGPAEVKIAHLVILTTKEMGFKEQLAVEKKLQSIRNECYKIRDLKKREELFYKKVEQEASPIYRKNNGYLGEFDGERLKGLFPQYLKAFDLKKGDISDIIPTETGRHIILVIDKKGGEPIDITKVRDRINQILMMQQGEKIFIQWMDEYSKKFDVKIK